MKDQSRFGIVLVAREKNVVVRASRLIDYVSEGIVVVGRCDGAGCGKERRDIRVGVVRSSRISGSLVLKEIGSVDIASDGIAEAVLFENDALVLVEVMRCGAVHGFRDAEAVAVIDVLDDGAVLGDRADQLVTEVVGVRLDDDRGAGDARGVGRAGRD